MLITKIRSRECRELLTRLGFGRLGCSNNDRPYIVPIYFAFDTERLCCFSTLGRKIEWMRENPLVCVEVDEIRGHDDWVSVIVLGKYLEIPNTPAYSKNREEIRSVLQRRSLWWQSGYTASQIRRRSKPVAPVFYIIQIEAVTGLRGSPNTREAGRPRSRAGQYNSM